MYGLLFQNFKIIDSHTFRIYEDGYDFYFDGYHRTGRKHQTGNIDKIVFPSFLPFNNCCLIFNDRVMWLLQKKMNKKESIIYAAILNDECFPIIKINYNLTGIKSVGGMQYFRLNNLEIIEAGIETEDYERDRIELDNKHIGALNSSITTIENFLNIISCKNIKTVKHTRNIKVKARKQGALVEYYTLQIKNFSSKGESESGKWHNRIHLVRGHMKEYTADKPLFGRITGRFWCPPHVRGQNKGGIIFKDYEV